MESALNTYLAKVGNASGQRVTARVCFTSKRQNNKNMKFSDIVHLKSKNATVFFSKLSVTDEIFEPYEPPTQTSE